MIPTRAAMWLDNQPRLGMYLAIPVAAVVAVKACYSSRQHYNGNLIGEPPAPVLNITDKRPVSG